MVTEQAEALALAAAELKKVLELERRRGYDDRATTLGLDRYLASWVTRSLARTASPPNVRPQQPLRPPDEPPREPRSPSDLDRFLAEVDPDGSLQRANPVEAQRRADAARRLYFVRLAYKSAVARARRSRQT